ncbi:hypothetical protein SCNU_00150 [Gordonia neofelifaecis NRRL B-59395]|uniref:Uncharacterized protein n=1 Tax=Gordonia neofelifaecis NRRL B-59395 TaxID=644548 RepID=F1YEA9_9ACTN|nr:hypothetical protein SCNU_00150 [Gordonia neofelifaecis NRRL B-59395]
MIRQDDVLPGFEPIVTVRSGLADVLDLTPTTAVCLAAQLVTAAGATVADIHTVGKGQNR